MTIFIRNATAEDSEAISNLVINVAKKQLREEFTDDGWALFLRLISKQTQKTLISDDQFVYRLACTRLTSGSEQVVGMLSSKNTTHIFHFFILPEYQRKGIGLKLWQDYLFHLPMSANDIITVKSSDFAYQFYLKLGFVKQQPRCIENGLVYTLMHYTNNTT